MIDPAACFEALEPFLNERERRRFAASEARTAGRGGVVAGDWNRAQAIGCGPRVRRRQTGDADSAWL
jgi:hypothetical protein